MAQSGKTESKAGLEKHVHSSPRETSLNNRCSSAQNNKETEVMSSILFIYFLYIFSLKETHLSQK